MEKEHASKKNIVLLFVVILAATLLSFGWNAFTGSVRIDSENYMERGLAGTNWNQIGRIALVWLTRLLGLETYSRVRIGVFFVIFFCLSCAVFCYGLYIAGAKDGKSPYWLAALLYCSCTVWMAQFYYTLQLAQVSLALLLTEAAALLLFVGVRTGKWYGYMAALPSAALLAFCISCYQSFLVVYISFGLILLLERMRHTFGRWEGAERQVSDRGRGSERRWVYREMLGFVLLFVTVCAGYLVYSVATKPYIVQGSGGYLELYNGWGHYNRLSENLYEIAKAVASNVFCVNAYGVSLEKFSLFALLGVLAVCYGVHFIRKTPRDMAALYYMFLLLAVLLSPFILIVCIGDGVYARSMFAICPVVAYLGFFLAAQWRGTAERLLRGGLLAGALVSVLINNYMVYADAQVQRQDDEVIAAVQEGLQGLEDFDGSLIMYGTYDVGGRYVNDKALGMYSVSHFSWDVYEEHVDTERIAAVANVRRHLGWRAVPPEEVQIDGGALGEMPVFPEEGYCCMADGTAVVRLGNGNPADASATAGR